MKEQMIVLTDTALDERMPAKVIYGAGEECPPPVHWHDNLEINYMVTGTWYININGQKKYTKQAYAEVVNSGAVHWITPVEQGEHDNLVIVFYLDFLKQYLPDIDDYTFESPGNATEETRVYAYLNRLYDIYRSSYEEAQSSRQSVPEKGAVQLEIRGILYALAYELMAGYMVRNQVNVRRQNSRYQERFKQACRFIDRNYREDIGLRELAAELGISQEYCSRSFRRFLGVSFKDYLTGVRMSHAYRMLLYSETPIVDIAMRTGFADVRSFDRSFLDMYHETPSGYRRRMKQEGGVHDVLHG